MKRILIIAGGTGGHIFPALAVARQLRQQSVTVDWLGTSGALEERLVATEFPFYKLSVTGLRGSGWRRQWLAPLQLVKSVFQAYRLIKKLNPEVVLGMGGYVTGPAGVAAWLARVPLVIHEQNAIAGLTNRWLTKIAARVLQAFPDTFNKNIRAITTGNPIRPELIATVPPEKRSIGERGPLRILILGGSQGASAINQAILKVMSDYPEKETLSIWHQTGVKEFDVVKMTYEKCSMSAVVTDFIEDMQTALAWADLIICRAGALTVSEIAAVGVASIFIPYPSAVDNHQFHNSRPLVTAGAAIVILQSELCVSRLSALIQQFERERKRLQTMAQSARRFAIPNATEQVIHACQQFSPNDIKDKKHDFGR